MYVCMYVCIYVFILCMYVCMYHAYVRIYIHTLTETYTLCVYIGEGPGWADRRRTKGVRNADARSETYQGDSKP